MRSHPRLILSALLLAPSGLFAAGNLQLPPDLVEVLPISKAGSYMGDAVRIVDCPLDKDNPFGTCGNVLVGGLAMYDSHLSGYIQIKFYAPLNNISHFEITVPGNLVGDNAIMRAPQWYQYPVAQNYVFDALGGVSSGDLNLITGETSNLNFNFNFFNTFYIGLAAVNPSLRGGPFAFPGPAGSAKVVFTQRQDGALDFTLYASTFLPLGNNISGDPVRLPLPFSGPSSPLGSFEAPGLSLHPHIRISTTDPGGVDCGAKCPDVPFNTIQVFTLNSQSSYDADRFSLNIPQLGAPGTANARSHMQGRLQIQFGERSGDTVPFALSLLLPEGLLANPPASPFPLPPGFSLGTLGHDEDLHFPGLTYHFSGVVMSDDNFDISVGAINLKTGEVVGELLYKGVFVQTLLIQVLLQNNGRIPAGSFEYRGPASFEKGPNSELVFRFIADNFRPFDGFIWPSPDFTTAARSFLAGPGSQLNPRMLLQGMRTTDTPRTTKSGSATNVLSSVGDRFNYSYTIPCDPAAAKTATFEYTNSNTRTGGTFKMSNPASVSCINSRQSTLPSGDYDVITLSGFGTWSKDDGLHLVNFQVSTTPGAPYVTVMIDAGTVSQANTPPAAEPIP